MEVLALTIFVSVVLVVGALWFFAWNLKQRTYEHDDRLALMPLSDGPHPTTASAAVPSSSAAATPSHRPATEKQPDEESP